MWVEIRLLAMAALAPVLTPHGRLLLAPADAAPELAEELTRRLRKAFARGAGHGLLQLGAGETRMALPPVLGYWREFSTRYVTTLCALPGVEPNGELPPIPAPPPADLESLAAAAPPMTGAEYLTPAVLQSLWTELDEAFRTELSASKLSVQAFLARKNPSWHLVGRVYFNLAENRKDEESPFAFLATYTTRLSADTRPHHLPLGRALSEYAGSANKPKLLSLLLPVQRAAEQCKWLKAMVDSGEVYYPLRWTREEAFQLLTDLPRLEAAGVIVRMPAAWRSKRPPRPRVSASVGSKPPAGLGTEALLDFEMHVTLDGERLTREEMAALLASAGGLQMVRGRWVEVDRESLARLLDEFRAVEKAAAEGALTFAEAMRLLSGAAMADDETAGDRAAPEWSEVSAGPWLSRVLEDLRHPETAAAVHPGGALHATLRPYQQTGLRWLHTLTALGLGACLADDMGLGKTMQILALLLALKKPAASDALPRTSLLVAPASLLANWAAEIARFAPTLQALVAHPSAMPSAELAALDEKRIEGFDLVITSYGTLLRAPGLTRIPWRLAILDEAQAIKNPAAKQTRAAHALTAQARIALTGTPVENRLGDLWSIFNVINPGLLGSSKDFTAFTRRLAARPQNPYGPLRELVRPSSSDA